MFKFKRLSACLLAWGGGFSSQASQEMWRRTKPDGWVHNSRSQGLAQVGAWKEIPRPESEQVLRVGIQHVNALKLHPYDHTSGSAWALLCNLFEGLYGCDPETGKVYPLLAHPDQWDHPESNAERTEWKFKLRTDGRWSDGKPVTAHDFVFGWRSLHTPANYVAAREQNCFPLDRQLARLRALSLDQAKQVMQGQASPETLGVWAEDDFTLCFRLTAPMESGLLLNRLAGINFIPMRPEFLEKNKSATVEANRIDWPCNGPFQLAHVQAERRILLKKNPNYWDARTVHLQEVEHYFFSDYPQLVEAWIAGRIDCAMFVNSSDCPMEEWVRGHLYGLLFPTQQLILLKNEEGPLKDKRVRQALNLLFDREKLIHAILECDTLDRLFGPLPESDLRVRPKAPDFAGWPWPERVQAAQRLLEAAGHTAERPLQLTLTLSKTFASSQGPFMAQLDESLNATPNLKVVLEGQEISECLSRRKTRNFDLLFQFLYLNDFNILTLFSSFTSTDGPNIHGYENDEYNRIYTRLACGPVPPNEYHKSIEALQHQLQEEVPCLFFRRCMMQFLVNDEVGGMIEPGTPMPYTRRSHHTANLLYKHLFIKKPVDNIMEYPHPPRRPRDPSSGTHGFWPWIRRWWRGKDEESFGS